MKEVKHSWVCVTGPGLLAQHFAALQYSRAEPTEGIKRSRMKVLENNKGACPV